MSIKKNIKNSLKTILTPFFCCRYGFPLSIRQIYVGKGAKIVNGKYFCLHGCVAFMPYSLVVARTKESHITIGKGVQIGMFSRIACDNEITIGDRVTLAQNVFVTDYNHQYEDIDKAIFSIDGQCQGIIRKPGEAFGGKNGIIIKDDSWLGANTVVAGTVVIGKHVVIGANSVVTHDIPDYSVAVGAPAKVIKRYNFETKQWEKC